MNWVDAIKGPRPRIGEAVLVFRQGYSINGKPWCSYEVAVYARGRYDRRRRHFVDQTAYRVGERDAWVWRDVTHWMYLPTNPPIAEWEGNHAS